VAPNETKGSYMRLSSKMALLVLVALFAMSAMAASSAWAAGKPFVETKAATASTATLNGVVNPNGAETKYHFEYGTTLSYGKSTAEVSVGSGSTNLEELQKVASLSPLTKYDFRIVATNGNGTSDGSNESFTTGGAEAPLAETGSATARTETGATLNGVVNPNDAETKYYFEYGTTISYGKKTAEASAGSGTASLNESKTVSGLTAKTTYHFRIVATNAKGTTDGADKTFYSNVGPEFNPFRAGETFTGSAGAYTWDFDGERIKCTASTLKGELTSAQGLGGLVISWSGCEGINGQDETCPANSVGAKEGEIVTKVLAGELGTVAKAEAETGVGLRFKPEAKKQWFFLAASKCFEETTFGGTLAVEVVGLSLSTTHKLLLHTGSSGGMKIKEITLDSGVVEKPEFEAGAEEVAMSTEYDLTFSAAVEVT
jgi:hypothetical protein